MHYAKYTQTGLANLIAHYERKNNDTREYENKNIDKDKTHLNYDLAKDPDDNRTGYQGQTCRSLSFKPSRCKYNGIYCNNAPKRL